MSHIRRRGVATALAVAFAATATAVPARADTCAASVNCNTTVTFTVSAGAGLQITVPNGPLSVGTGSPGGTISGQLGSITVSDQRAAVTATWVAQVVATDFTTGGGSAAETIANSRVSYWSGPATATTGTGTFVPGQANAASSVVLDQTRIAFSKTTGSGNNSATWNPTIVIDVPAQAVAGTYTGVVRHSVA
ncbi:hypothetical protein [Nonomuraea roseoviolacea]|uniref:WxL domain-containing protein n=1 Tax=Nonomuraea roseoviolacea subsp. carminata TaxID=160689 RepID=A0ABT1K5Q6_9ACTN|nr:hypothetical protein [Nonomuraea roseoviolacea]MCP2349334.1 hypothetical protein [Nonomuraea roseoviolacea subsp. carminata]